MTLDSRVEQNQNPDDGALNETLLRGERFRLVRHLSV
jgi:hypothetical protein